MLMWTVLTWILTPILIMFFQFNGIAMAAFLISFTSVVPIYYVKKTVHLNILDQVWRQAVAAVMMGGAGWLGMTYWVRSIPLFVSGMVGTSLVYLIVMMVIGRQKLLGEVRSLRS
jgi:hypothetical protein